MTITVSSLDDVRIEVLGEARAITIPAKRILEAIEQPAAKPLIAVLQEIFEIATRRRMTASQHTDNLRPEITPYAETQSEAFCYWRGVREGLMGINAMAHDAIPQELRVDAMGERT